MATNGQFEPLGGLSSIFVPQTPGVYALSRDGVSVHYIGRTDSDLSTRIFSSANEGRGYRYFWYNTASSAAEAFGWECDLFHKYTPPDNQIHPAAPAGTFQRCPKPGCLHALGALAQIFNAAARSGK